jgi:inorganic pyrophosphatase
MRNVPEVEVVAVPTLVGLEGDLLDAAVLGPRLAVGTRLRVRAWGPDQWDTGTDRGQ